MSPGSGLKSVIEFSVRDCIRIFFFITCVFTIVLQQEGGRHKYSSRPYARASLFFIFFWFLRWSCKDGKNGCCKDGKYWVLCCLTFTLLFFSWGYFCTLSILLLVSFPGSEVRWGLYDSEGMIWLSAWISSEPTWVYPCHRDWSIATLLGPKVRWERYDPQGWSDSRLESLQNPRESSLVIETYPPSVS